MVDSDWRPPAIGSENPGPELAIAPASALYVATMDVLDVSAIREFWLAHPLERGGRLLSEVELYRALWRIEGTISAHYCQWIWNDIEPFLYRHGMRGEGLIRDEILRMNQSLMFKASHVLGWIKETLPNLYRDSNPMLTVVDILGSWSEGAFPGSWCETLRHRRHGGWDEAVSAWIPSPDFSFRFFYPVELHSTPFHKAIPRYFGMPPYDQARPIADCRPLSAILWNESVEIQAEVCVVDGRRVGDVIAFSEWLRQEELDLKRARIPDWPVIRIDRDYVCPKRERVVLLEGCVYDAPLYLASFRFRSDVSLQAFSNAGAYLDKITNELLQSDEAAWAPFVAIHEQLIASAEEKLSFEFLRGADALRLNGKTLFTGVPARLLFKILVAHTRGQKTFDYRSFKLDPELFRDPKRTGFEVRFRRLLERLARDAPALKLQRTREGQFEVSASCPILLSETN
jgi:hypothetical protein